MTENLAVLVVYDRKIHSKKVYDTMCDFVYDTKHGYMVSGILLKIWVYDTKMYDTKCKTIFQGDQLMKWVACGLFGQCATFSI